MTHATRVFFLRFRFGDRKEILRDRMEEFERPFSIDVISGHYILRDRWRNLRDRFGPSKHLKKTLHATHMSSEKEAAFGLPQLGPRFLADSNNCVNGKPQSCDTDA